MPKTAACRSAAELEQLLSQPLALPADAAEELAHHLEQCARCAETVHGLLARDTLANAARAQGGLPEPEPSTRVRELISQLTKLGQIRAKAPLVFPCSHCGKSIKCKAELAGKKGKCPHCGNSVLLQRPDLQAQTNTPAPARGEERTLPPKDSPIREPGAEAKNMAPGVNLGQDSAKNSKSSSGASMFNDVDLDAMVGTHSDMEQKSGASLFKDVDLDAMVGTHSDVKKENEEAWDFLARAQAPDEIGRLGPYRILKVLGVGGMGVVFRAEDPGLKRIVALKAMLPALAASPSAKKRFLREAQTVASIKHDHIVTIFQVGEDRVAPYLAMEFLHGEPLDVRLKRTSASGSGSLPLPDVLRIGEQIAEGLAAAHDEGLIHRDIKPANIWMEIKVQKSDSQGQKTKSKAQAKSSDGQPAGGYRVKILDFGLARSTSDRAGLTQSGAILGTPSYMAPEQASGKSVDHRCDLFSLGCVLYVMSTGQLPFEGDDTLTVLMAIANTTPPPPRKLNSEVPGALSKLIMQLLAKKPEERPGSAQEVVETLRTLHEPTAMETTAQTSGQAQDRSPEPKREEKARRHGIPSWALIAGGIAALLAAVVVISSIVAVIMRRDSNNPRPDDLIAQGSDNSPKKDGDLNAKGVEKPITVGTKKTGTPTNTDDDAKKTVPASPGKEEPSRERSKEFTNSLGMKFVWIPPGSFIMGSPKDEEGRRVKHPEIQHKVTLTKGFYLGKYTVTQEEWRAIMGKNTRRFVEGKDQPVQGLSWENCLDFCKKLREKDKKLYRLPTEAEWEYACRAGTTTPFYFGETISTDLANYDGNTSYGIGIGKKGVFRQKTTPVGSFPPNAWGLHDMHGNVSQWCQDWSGNYSHEDVIDPQGPDSGLERVLRGGSYIDSPQFCRSGFSYADMPRQTNFVCGIRLCFTLDDDAKKIVAKEEPVRERPKEFTGLPMTFVWIPPGSFMMGSPKEEKGREAYGGGGETQHKVTLTKGFYMGKYTVTQEQWEWIMGNNPSYCKGEKNLPVEQLSWYKCQEFIKKLREKDKKPYRLPTEAEWEYACRAGTTTPFHFGDTISAKLANYDSQGIYGNGKSSVPRKKTTPVGSFPPNAWGLHDMHGNVWQWCENFPAAYPDYDVVDPKGPNAVGSGILRGVLRGGSHYIDPGRCRAAHRFVNDPDHPGFDFGMRLCYSLDDDAKKIVPANPGKGEYVRDKSKDFTNSIGMKFVWIPPGSFMMGSPKEEIGRQVDGGDETQHKVTLTKGFYMGVYTVTQEEWQAAMGNNPSKFKGEQNLPVEEVSWDDCQEFIKKLREKDKKPYRLPSEAEWEYACRAGTTTPFFFGETISTDQANYNGDYIYGTGKKGVNRVKTISVGSFPANAFGLHDMHGNVWQWCQDRGGDYPQKDVVDPTGPESGPGRMLRGGSWVGDPRHCRSAYRHGGGPGLRLHDFGFRVAFCLD